MSEDNLHLALRIARDSAPSVNYNDADVAIVAMQSLGYEFVSPGTPGRYLESDDAHRGLAEYLRTETGLSFASAIGILNGLKRLNLQIREPDQHPSGLRSQEYAFVKVAPFGAKHAAAMKTIERSGFDTNGVEIPNR